MQTSSLRKGVLQRGPSRGMMCRPPLAGHASVASKTHSLRKAAAVVVCAAPSKHETEGKTSSMPRLPPRKEKPQQPASPTSAEQGTQSHKSSSSNRSRPKRLGSFGGGPNQPPPYESPQSVMQEKALAGLLAYTGLMGTVATAVAFIAPDIDLFGGFHWDAADVSLALKLMLPVYGLNLLIMLPNYSSWKLPEVTAESQAAMVEAIAKWSARKGGKSSSSSSVDAAGSAGDHASAAAAREGPAAESAAASQAAEAAALKAVAEPGTSQELAEQAVDVAATAAAGTALASSSSSSSSSSSAAAEASTVPSIADATPTTSSSTPSNTSRSSSSSDASEEDSWISRQLKRPTIMRMRDALYMAQGHYLSINPAVVLPLPLQATVLLVDCLAAELLYRSVALQLAGGWIGDRIVEAGADDVLDSLLASLPVLPTHASGQLVAVALLSAASGVAMLRNMRRMARRPQMMLGAQGRQAAGQLLTDLQDKHRRQQRQQQQQDASSSSSSSSTSTTESKPGVSPKDQQRQQEQQESASRAAADWAVAAAKAAGKQQQQGSAPLEPQWSRRIPSTLSGLALSQLVQGARDISQMTALGLSFVLTGNLAAPFAAAVVNQAMMSALQKRGLERARQRSIAMAKHLAGITRQLRDAQRKQDERKRQQQQGEQQQLAASTDAVQDAMPATSAADGTPGSSAGSSDANSTAAAVVQHAAASAALAPAAAAATSAAAGEEADPAAAAAAGRDAAAPAGESLVASRMERTINVLDQLLGQLGEHATAGPGPGK